MGKKELSYIQDDTSKLEQNIPELVKSEAHFKKKNLKPWNTNIVLLKFFAKQMSISKTGLWVGLNQHQTNHLGYTGLKQMLGQTWDHKIIYVLIRPWKEKDRLGFTYAIGKGVAMYAAEQCQIHCLAH